MCVGSVQVRKFHAKRTFVGLERTRNFFKAVPFNLFICDITDSMKLLMRFGNGKLQVWSHQKAQCLHLV